MLDRWRVSRALSAHGSRSLTPAACLSADSSPNSCSPGPFRCNGSGRSPGLLSHFVPSLSLMYPRRHIRNLYGSQGCRLALPCYTVNSYTKANVHHLRSPHHPPVRLQRRLPASSRRSPPDAVVGPSLRQLGCSHAASRRPPDRQPASRLRRCPPLSHRHPPPPGGRVRLATAAGDTQGTSTNITQKFYCNRGQGSSFLCSTAAVAKNTSTRYVGWNVVIL